MRRSVPTKLLLRFMSLLVIGIVTLALELLWLGGQAPSWAAPEQNPNLQTLPTRLPDDEPTPGPPSPVPSPVVEPPTPKPGKDQDDGNHDSGALPGQPAEQRNEGSPTQVQPTRLPEQKGGQGQKGATPRPTAEPGRSQEQSLIARTSTPTALPPARSTLSEIGRTSVPEAGDTKTSTSPILVESSAEAAVSGESGSLYWLYFLILGVFLIGGGIFLVHRG